MRRRIAIPLVVGTAMALAAGVLAVRSRAPAERVYTVAQITAGLAQQPRAWVGRVVRVQGRAVVPACRGAMPCPGAGALLVDLHAPDQHVRLTWRAINPVLGALLHVPYLDGLVAQRLGGVGVYRVLITRSINIVPPGNSPTYFPYTEKMVVVNDDRAVLVDGLN